LHNCKELVMAKATERKAQMQAMWAETRWDDLAVFIGPNADRFRAAWEKQQAIMTGKGYGFAWSFCWPALFLTFVWFFYRKQWLAGGLMTVGPLVIGFFFPSLSGALGGIGIAFATMAKSFYFHDAIPKIAKIRAEGGDVAALAATGGVSWLAGIASGLIFAALLAGSVMLMRDAFAEDEGMHYSIDNEYRLEKQ
jgi:hypothetical protein